MKYSEALRYLKYLQEFRVKLGLERVKNLAERLGNPWKDYHYIIIAGTNGKGSVGAFLSSILSRKYKVGFNSSPHLVFPEERIRINGQPIAREKFGYYIGQVAKASEKVNRQFPHPITFFETLTATAMLVFREEGMDFGIFEVGMGGRLDATNIAEAQVSVLTEIALDHTKHLGETIREIAKEKSFVIKGGRTVIGTRQKRTNEIFIKRARETGAKVRLVFKDKNFRIVNPLREFLYRGKEEYILKPSLLGSHQGRNAAVAVATTEELREEGYKITKEDILKGITSAFWPGRLESAGNITIDGVHNCNASHVIKDYLEVSGPWDILVFGLLRDKDYKCMGKNIFPFFRKIILSEIESRRKMPAEQLIPLASRYADIHVRRDPVDALNLARELSGGKIFAGGSLYLIGRIRAELLKEGLLKKI